MLSGCKSFRDSSKTPVMPAKQEHQWGDKGEQPTEVWPDFHWHLEKNKYLYPDEK